MSLHNITNILCNFDMYINLLYSTSYYHNNNIDELQCVHTWLHCICMQLYVHMYIQFILLTMCVCAYNITVLLYLHTIVICSTWKERWRWNQLNPTFFIWPKHISIVLQRVSSQLQLFSLYVPCHLWKGVTDVARDSNCRSPLAYKVTYIHVHCMCMCAYACVRA